MITIDELRRIAIKQPTYMGLGMIKVSIPHSAYRFYCPDVAPQTTDQHHTHTNSFQSTVLKGVLRNIVYDVTPVDYETNWQWTQGKCSPRCTPEVIHENVEPVETLRFDTLVDSGYQIDAQVFHRIELVTDKVITKLTVTERGTVDPIYILDKKLGYQSPWAVRKTPAECWEAIEYILDDND